MRQSPKVAQILAGMAVLVVAHVLFWLLAYALAALGASAPPGENLVVIALVLVFGIGISQLLYVIPLCIWLSRRQQIGMRTGVVIGAVLTALLNGSCFIYFLSVW